jgi:predicted kinase
MQTLYAMCGLAFSGKSTAARRIAAALGAALVSLDAIHAARGLDPGADLDEAHWEETAAAALREVREWLRQGRSVVVDDTFSYRALRDRFREAADRHGCNFLIVFMDVPAAVRDARIETNRLRPTRPHVRPEVVAFIVDEFEPPGPDEPVVRFTEAASVEAWIDERRPVGP